MPTFIYDATFEWKIFGFNGKNKNKSQLDSLHVEFSRCSMDSRSEIKVPWNLTLNYDACSQLLIEHEAHFAVKTTTKQKKCFNNFFPDAFSPRFYSAKWNQENFVHFHENAQAFPSFPQWLLQSFLFSLAMTCCSMLRRRCSVRACAGAGGVLFLKQLNQLWL